MGCRWREKPLVSAKVRRANGCFLVPQEHIKYQLDNACNYNIVSIIVSIYSLRAPLTAGVCWGATPEQSNNKKKKVTVTYCLETVSRLLPACVSSYISLQVVRDKQDTKIIFSKKLPTQSVLLHAFKEKITPTTQLLDS